MSALFNGVRKALGVGLFLTGSVAAHAASQTWTGASGTDTNWSDAGNWSVAVPGTTGTTTNTDTAIFTGTVTNLTVSMDQSFNLANIQFGGINSSNTAAAASYTIGATNGSSLLLSSGGYILDAVSNSGTETVSAPIVIENASAGTNGTATFDAAGAGNQLVISGGVTGAATSGTTTLTLDGNNNGGGLISGVIGDGTGGGNLALAVNFSTNVNGGGQGSTTWVLSNANTYSGGTTINHNAFSGTLEISNSTALGTGTVTFNGSDTLESITNSLTLTNAFSIASGVTAQLNTNSNMQINGLISGLGGFQKTGNGILTLGSSTANTFSGGVTINAGTIRINNGTTSLGTGNLTINSGGTLDLSANAPLLYNLSGSGTITSKNYSGANVNVTNSSNTTFSGTILNGSSGATNTRLTKSGAGTLTLSGSNSYATSTTINAGTLQVGNLSALGTGSVTVANGTTTGGTLDVNGYLITNLITSLNGSLINSGAAVDFSGTNSGTSVLNGLSDGGNSIAVAGTGNITVGTVTGSNGLNIAKTGTNTLTLAGAADNSYLAVTENGGTIIVNKGTTGSAANNFTLTTGTLQYGTGAATTNSREINNLTVNGGTVDLNGASGIAANVLTLNGLSTGTITNTSGTAATLMVNTNSASTSAYAGLISSGVSLVLSGNGGATLTLSGSNTYTGSTTVIAGTLSLGNASALSTSAVSLGGGTLDLGGQTITNALTLTATSTITNSSATAASDVSATDGTTATITSNSTLNINGMGNLTVGSISGGGFGNVVSKTGTNFLTLAGTKDNSFLAVNENGGTVVLNKSSTTGAHAANNFTLTTGTLQFGTNTSTGGATGQINGTLTINGGTVDLNGASGIDATMQNLAGSGGTITNTNATAATLTLTNGGTYAGTIQNGTGTTAVTATTAGTLALTGSNTYSGPTTINSAATLQTGNASALGTSTITVASGGTLDLDGQTITNAFASGGLAGAGVGGNGALINSNTTTAASDLTTMGNAAVAGSISSFTVGGAGNITLGTITGGSPWTLTKIGAGTLTLAGTADNSYANVVENGGTLVLAKTGAGHVANSLTLTSGKVQYGTAGSVSLLNGTGQINSVTINGGTLDLNGASGANATIGALSGSGGVIVNNSATNAAATLTVGGNNSGGGTFSGAIQNGTSTGGLSLIQTGSGTTTLAGVNTYTGGTSIAGTLALSGAGQLGGGIYAGAMTDNGLFNDSSSANQTLSGNITGSGALTESGTGTLTLSGSNSYTGVTTISAGTLLLGSATALPTNSLSGGAGLVNNATLDLGGHNVAFLALPNGTGAYTSSSGTPTLTLNNISGTIGNNFTGSLALSLNISGAAALSGANTYSGGTTVTNGTLSAQSDGDFGTGNLVIAPSGSNAVVVNTAAATQTLASTANVTVNNGGGSGTLNFNDFAPVIASLSGNGSVVLNNQNGQVLTVGNNTTDSVFSGVISENSGGLGGAIVKTGTDKLTLSGSNTYTDNSQATTASATEVQAGILNIQNNSALGSGGAALVDSGATLQLQGGITETGNALTVSGTGATNATGALENVSGSNSYGGGVTLAGATTIASDAGNLDIPRAGGAITTTAGSANLTLTGAGNGSIEAAINTGGSTLTKSGAGTWTLAGANGFTGATTISGGTLNVTGSISGSAVSVSSGATLSGTGSTGFATISGGGSIGLQNGSIGTLTVSGLSTGQAGTASSLTFDIGSSAGSIDTIADNGTLTLNGVGGTTITIGNASGVSTLASGLYNLITYTGAYTGSLSDLTLSTTTLDGQTLSLVQGVNSIELQVGSSTLASAYFNGQGNNLNTAANYDPSATAGASTGGTVGTASNVFFAANRNGSTTPNISAPLEVNSVNFGAGTAGVQSGITVSSSNTSDTLTVDATGANGNTAGSGITVASGSDTISAPVVLGGSQSWTTTGSTTSLNVSGQVSGAYALTKAGTGGVTLSNPTGNIYTGGTTVNAGTLYVTNTSNSGTGTGAVTVNSGGTLAGNGFISTTSGVAINGGGSLVSGSRSQISGTGLASLGGMSLVNTALTVGSSVGTANLTFDLAAGNSGIGGGSAGFHTFANPNNNTTYLSLNGSSSINFAGATSISLVDLTNTNGHNGSLALLTGTPYLLIHAASNSEYLNLVINSGTNANPILSLSQNDTNATNGYVLGVWAGGSNPLTDYTAISIAQYGADGVTPLVAGPGGTYPAPALYLDAGNLEVVPEPGTWALMIGGLALLVVIQRRRNKVG